MMAGNPPASASSSTRLSWLSLNLKAHRFRGLHTKALQTAVQRAAAQAECAGGMADIAAVTRQGFLDQEFLHVFEAHIFETRRTPRRRHAEPDRPL